MKNVLVYFCLFFYVSALLTPMSAIIRDTLAHTFWKAQHMATIHYENGHYHLHKELNDIAVNENGNPAEKTPISQKTTESVSVHISQLFDFQFNPGDGYSLVNDRSEKDLTFVFIPINSPPPKS